eukprot:TRINITY_DN4662_c0_g1_i7.p1 TRINITY_DN4662_c0_g1~~TRINITY_DN4662_c0_g1_i7.p1  ORF type:complete len:210 (-),score=40.69 TRINITY_DN4662_c0_g1_i7:296-925(-)
MGKIQYKKKMDSITAKATTEHVAFCFDVLEKYLETPKGFKTPPLPATIADIKVPLFVTWYTVQRGERNLRGCIGTFEPESLSKNLGRYTLISALEDDRFSPISKRELPSLECEVNLLVNFEQGRDAFDWEVGKHGIQISFNENNEVYDATYLPHVASEQRWDHEKTLRSLIRKAGYRGSPDVVLPKLSLTRYQSSESKLTYGEYKRLRQ